MRELDNLGLSLCKMQGNLFAESVKRSSGSAVFIRRFMNSEVAKRMDNTSQMFNSESLNSMLNEIENEFNNKEYGKVKYSEEELYWIGYIYRYWSYVYEKENKNIYKIIGSKEIRNLYFPYHSLDPKCAIERILEAKGKNYMDINERGVIVLRNIMRKNGEI